MNKKKENLYYNDYDIPIKNNIKNYYKQPPKANIKKKRKLKLWVWIVIFIILITITIISITKIILWSKNNLDTNNIIEKTNTNYELVEDNKNTEYINKPTNENDDYYYYIKFPLINVNFTELLKKNSDTIAWINVNNTNINYPIVQTTNNNYYLNHSFNKKQNDAGWVFMDYRNNKNFDNKNTIIYAHNRLNKTMFGSLSEALKESWYKNKDNHIIRISTPTENTSWQIFSVYKIKTETYYITTDFTNEEYEQFLTTIKNRSKYNFNTNLSANDQIITLSTCYSNSEKTVVHAKLIKKETREN